MPPELTARVADSPAAVPVVFWLSVGNVQLARLPEVGVPKRGVVNVGLVESTTDPVPVEVVTPVPPEATANVADKPPAVPEVFWLNVGQVNVPVLKLPEVGVPSRGVVNDGLVDSTFAPEPVEVVTPVPPLVTAKVPDTSAVKDTDPHVGAPEALPCRTWVEVPANVVAIAVVVEPYKIPYWVKAVACPVPPLVTANVPVMSEVLRLIASQLVFVPSV